MSKHNLFNQPGIEQLIPGRELPVAVKVTGRNMHAVSLLASVTSEKNKARSGLAVCFEDDGSLGWVTYKDAQVSIDLEPGDYLVLADDRSTVLVMDEQGLELARVALPLLAGVNDAFDTLANFLR